LHQLNAHRVLSNSGSSFELDKEFFSCTPCTDPSSKVFSNLEVPLELVIALVHPPGTFFSDSTEVRCTLLALAIEPPMFCCALLAQPKESRMILHNSMKIK
jgi:hypothetical protein